MMNSNNKGSTTSVAGLNPVTTATTSNTSASAAAAAAAAAASNFQMPAGLVSPNTNTTSISQNLNLNHLTGQVTNTSGTTVTTTTTNNNGLSLPNGLGNLGTTITDALGGANSINNNNVSNTNLTSLSKNNSVSNAYNSTPNFGTTDNNQNSSDGGRYPVAPNGSTNWSQFAPPQ